MKHKFIAFFIATVMFVQIFPVASLMLLTKSLDTDYAAGNEIGLSISLQQIEEDNTDTGKTLTDLVDWNTLAVLHNAILCKAHFAQNDNNSNKGHILVLILPPNFTA